MSPSERSDRAAGFAVRRRNMLSFVLVVVVWFMIDLITKGVFNAYEPGQVIAGPFLGIFQFTLVHNTGAAWGVFGDMTLVLGIFSILVCAAVVAYLFFYAPESSFPLVLGEHGVETLAGIRGVGHVTHRARQRSSPSERAARRCSR